MLSTLLQAWWGVKHVASCILGFVFPSGSWQWGELESDPEFWMLSVWSFAYSPHVARFSGFLTGSTNTEVGGLAALNCPEAWVNVWWVAMDWHPVQCVSMPCSKRHIKHSKFNSFSIFFCSLYQVWAQRESTGWAATRLRWRACSGNLTKVRHVTVHCFAYSFSDDFLKKTDLKRPANIPEKHKMRETK